MAEQIRETIVTVASTPQLIVKADATRLSLGFFVPSPNVAAFATNPALWSAMGQNGLPANSTIAQILTRQNLRIGITFPWYCLFTSGGNMVYVYEVYDPDQPYYSDSTVDDAAAIMSMAIDPVSAGESPDRLRELLSELLRLMGRRR